MAEISQDSSPRAHRGSSATQDGIDRRRRKLEADKNALDVTPTTVRCAICSSIVKLSDKSQYDNHHWKTHIGRCKRKPGFKAARRSAGAGAALRGTGNPSGPGPAAPSTGIDTNPSNSSSPPLASTDDTPPHWSTQRVHGDTPPLTPDRQSSEAPSSSASEVRQPSPPLPPLVRPASIYAPNSAQTAIQQWAYLAHRTRAANTAQAPQFAVSSDRWQDWSCKELQYPAFSPPESSG